MSFRPPCAAALAAAFSLGSLHAQDLAIFGFDGNLASSDGDATSVASDLRTTHQTQYGPSRLCVVQSWPDVGSSIEFSIVPMSGYELDFDGFDLDYFGSSHSTFNRIELTSSLDGHATPLFERVDSPVVPVGDFSIDLASVPGMRDVRSPVTFRLSFHRVGGWYSTQHFEINGIDVRGRGRRRGSGGGTASPCAATGLVSIAGDTLALHDSSGAVLLQSQIAGSSLPLAGSAFGSNGTHYALAATGDLAIVDPSYPVWQPVHTFSVLDCQDLLFDATTGTGFLLTRGGIWTFDESELTNYSSSLSLHPLLTLPIGAMPASLFWWNGELHYVDTGALDGGIWQVDPRYGGRSRVRQDAYGGPISSGTDGRHFIVEGVNSIHRIDLSTGVRTPFYTGASATLTAVAVENEAYGPGCSGTGALIVYPKTLPRITEHPFEILGTDPASVSIVRFGGVTVPRGGTPGSQHGGWQVTSTTLLLWPPANAGGSRTIDVVANGRVRSALVATEPSIAPTVAVPGVFDTGGDLTIYGDNGSLAGAGTYALVFSSSPLPSSLPGIVSLDLGGGFTDIRVAPSVNGSPSVHPIGRVPASLAGTTLYVQGLIIDSTFTLPLWSTNRREISFR